ncbi:MAG: suppressor of fused domain protein [Myxococcota bacterium]
MAEDVVLRSESPNGNAEAVVEDDGRAVYLYQYFPEGLGQELRATWVRNRVAAPAEVVRADMEQGLAPLMPARFCAHPQGAPAVDPTRAKLVWLPDGNGVALFEGPDVVACTVPWHGRKDCPGYARDAVGQAPFAWRLEQADEIAARFRAAQRYWDSWESRVTWEEKRRAVREALERSLGPQQSYREEAVAWPPLGLGVFQSDRAVTVATVGMSQRPMPAVELAHAEPRLWRRVELAVALPHGASELLRERVADLLTLASELPWQRYTWLGHGHTVPADAFKGTPFTGVLVASSAKFAGPVPLPEVDGDPVTLLWLVPVTAEELTKVRGGAADGFLAGVQQPRPFADTPSPPGERGNS